MDKAALEKLDAKIQKEKRRNATARERKGQLVWSVEQLIDLARQKRSVFVEPCLGLKPAMVVANMSAMRVHRMIQSGAVFEYCPKSKKETV